jgi:hypothetical protein
MSFLAVATVMERAFGYQTLVKANITENKMVVNVLGNPH